MSIQGTASLRERLQAGALANTKLKLEIAEEWFPLEQEAGQRLEHEERAAAKEFRGAPKSSARAKALMRKYIPEGRRLSDELVDERRAEAARESKQRR